jgi:hypothetical protein
MIALAVHFSRCQNAAAVGLATPTREPLTTTPWQRRCANRSGVTMSRRLGIRGFAEPSPSERVPALRASRDASRGADARACDAPRRAAPHVAAAPAACLLSVDEPRETSNRARHWHLAGRDRVKTQSSRCSRTSPRSGYPLSRVSCERASQRASNEQTSADFDKSILIPRRGKRNRFD